MSRQIVYLYCYDASFHRSVGSRQPSNLPNAYDFCDQLREEVYDSLFNLEERIIRKTNYVVCLLKQDGRMFVSIIRVDGKLRIGFGLIEECAEDEDFKLTSKYLNKKLKRFDEMDEIAKCRAKVDEIKEIMTKNIDHMLNNLLKTTEILEEANNLQKEANQFERQTVSIRNQEIGKNALLLCIIFVIVLALLVILVFLVLGVFGVIGIVVGIVTHKKGGD